ncbi:MAG: response regulator transcription factor [Cellulosilyticum sp.]|nr:response regulator transcription factor [Cellulosilyticum sp.]
MNLLIVDDDQLIVTSLKIILESDPNIHVIGTGTSGEEALNLFTILQPDILLMDIRMPGLTGIETGQKLLLQYPETKILYLTTFTDDEYIVEALRIGAKGYLLKQDFDSLIPALYAVYKGQNVFGNEIINKLPQLLVNEASTRGLSAFNLTDKEQLIIEEVANGLNNKEIAEKLFLGEGTIRNYISTILDKLELRDRTQLAIFYYKHLS